MQKVRNWLSSMTWSLGGTMTWPWWPLSRRLTKQYVIWKIFHSQTLQHRMEPFLHVTGRRILPIKSQSLGRFIAYKLEKFRIRFIKKMIFNIMFAIPARVPVFQLQLGEYNQSNSLQTFAWREMTVTSSAIRQLISGVILWLYCQRKPTLHTTDNTDLYLMYQLK